MIEIILLIAGVGGLLTSIGLFRTEQKLTQLKDQHTTLYKDFHELNLFVRGILSLPESERPKPAKKITVEDMYGGSKTRRAIDEAVAVASSTWSKTSEGN